MNMKDLIMKKILLGLLPLLLLPATLPAMADPSHRHMHGVERGRLTIHTQQHHHAYRGGHGHHGRGWGWAPWVGVAALGTTIYWANQYTPPATVIVSPPVVLDPGRVAYFCQTAQQYYPTVPTCNVPWQLVNY